MVNNNLKETNWEKIGIYIACIAGFLTILFYIVEMKVDIGQLQIEVNHLKIHELNDSKGKK